MFTTAEILELVKAGVTAAEIVELQRASAAAGASSAVAAPPKVKASTPDWIIQHGINKAARRALAAELRAAGVDLSTPKGQAEWRKAKKAAGIK